MQMPVNTRGVDDGRLLQANEHSAVECQVNVSSLACSDIPRSVVAPVSAGWSSDDDFTSEQRVTCDDEFSSASNRARPDSHLGQRFYFAASYCHVVVH